MTDPSKKKYSPSLEAIQQFTVYFVSHKTMTHRLCSVWDLNIHDNRNKACMIYRFFQYINA